MIGTRGDMDVLIAIAVLMGGAASVGRAGRPWSGRSSCSGPPAPARGRTPTRTRRRPRAPERRR